MNKLKEMKIEELLNEYERVANAKSPSFKDREKICEVIRIEASTRPAYQKDYKDLYNCIEIKEHGDYKVVVNMKDIGSSNDRKKAFQMLVIEVLKAFKDGGSQMMLDQGCWVQFQNHVPLMFYEARDLCWTNNWIRKNDKGEVEIVP